MRFPAEGGAVGVEIFGSGEVAGVSAISSFGELGAGDVSGAGAESDVEG